MSCARAALLVLLPVSFALTIEAPLVAHEGAAPSY
jgi:hypothetical protein